MTNKYRTWPIGLVFVVGSIRVPHNWPSSIDLVVGRSLCAVVGLGIRHVYG